ANPPTNLRRETFLESMEPPLVERSRDSTRIGRSSAVENCVRLSREVGSSGNNLKRRELPGLAFARFRDNPEDIRASGEARQRNCHPGLAVGQRGHGQGDQNLSALVQE